MIDFPIVGAGAVTEPQGGRLRDPAGHRFDVSLHRDVAVRPRDLRVAAREQDASG
jgi:hypothetical protein